jgi:hypothetical protein
MAPREPHAAPFVAAVTFGTSVSHHLLGHPNLLFLRIAGSRGGNDMKCFRRLVIFLGVASVLVGDAALSQLLAGQGLSGFFLHLPFFAPARRERHRALRHKRHSHRLTQQKFTQSYKRRQTALPVPDKAAIRQHSSNCEAAQAVVAEYGFTNIKPELCTRETLALSATRDGKLFSIEISARNGELTKVQRLH